MSQLTTDDMLHAKEIANSLYAWALSHESAPYSDIMLDAADCLSLLIGKAETSKQDGVTPHSVLSEAISMINARGKNRDNGQERSMERIVKVFHALTDHKMTEVEGWLFMVVLKLCRERTGPDLDNWVDGAAYMGLAAEAVHKSKGFDPA